MEETTEKEREKALVKRYWVTERNPAPPHFPGYLLIRQCDAYVDKHKLRVQASWV